MLYETERWATKKQYLHKMNIPEMRMLRWICGKLEKLESEMNIFVKW